MPKKKPSERAYARLTRHERQAIERMLDRGKGCREIAREIGRAPGSDPVVRGARATRSPSALSPTPSTPSLAPWRSLPRTASCRRRPWPPCARSACGCTSSRGAAPRARPPGRARGASGRARTSGRARRPPRYRLRRIEPPQRCLFPSWRVIACGVPWEYVMIQLRWRESNGWTTDKARVGRFS